MALKLEDLIAKKKEPGGIILDLAKVKIRTKEEFETHFEQIPEFKIRPEKVRYEDCKMRDTDFKFVLKKKEAKRMLKKKETYGDPVPVSMRSVRLEDLAAVDIHWKMLTMARPLNKLEEEIFNRLVDLGKLRARTRKYEDKLLAAASAAAPPGFQSTATLANMGIVISKNRRGVTETRCRVCKECGEELCTGALCKDFPYDSYTRLTIDKDDLDGQEEGDEKPEKPGGRSSRRPSKKILNTSNNKNKTYGGVKPAGSMRRAKVKSKSPQKRAPPPPPPSSTTLHNNNNKPLTEKLNKLRKKKIKKKRKERSVSPKKNRRGGGKTSDSDESDD